MVGLNGMNGAHVAWRVEEEDKYGHECVTDRNRKMVARNARLMDR